MGQTIFQVDSFTSRAFAGNPAAVCIVFPPISKKAITVHSFRRLEQIEKIFLKAA